MLKTPISQQKTLENIGFYFLLDTTLLKVLDNKILSWDNGIFYN